MQNRRLSIGELAARTCCPVATVRYYEKIGLLQRSKRADNGHRYYGEEDCTKLSFIKRCRDFGFPIEQVRSLVDLFANGDRPCAELRQLAQEHLDEVRVKLKEIWQLEASLAAYVHRCDQSCKDGRTKECVILESLASPTSGACCGSVATPSST